MGARVVDASILGALVFGEPRAEEARRSLQPGPLFAPTLLSYELVSIARKKTMQQPEDAETIARALHLGLALDVTLIDPDHASVLQRALTTGLSTHDASYLELAHRLNIPLVTFDDRLAAAFRQMKA